MLRQVFDPDNMVWTFIGKLIDMVLITILWAVCCIPVITAGAATAALYTVTMKMLKNEDGYLCRGFFNAFTQNFWHATRVWLVFLVSGGVLTFAGWFYLNIAGAVGAIILPALACLAVMYIMTITYVFPLMTMIDAKDGKLIMLSFMMAVKNFGWTLLMVVTTGCMAALGLFVSPIFLAVGAGLAAYIHCWEFKIILKQYQFSKEQENLA